jgi:hypothetical protein
MCLGGGRAVGTGPSEGSESAPTGPKEQAA